jgi:SAM-dependent methyltransferase
VSKVTRSRHDRSLSFGSAAAAYERGRPSYPPEAIDWLLPAGASKVLDLGAGTGKLTTRLVERGLDVVAVDPIPDMLEVLSASLPNTLALEGTAEEIPLEDNSVDAVLVAQAWHWVDPERAIPEVARVLRPGGRLGLVWNTRDERLGWVRELGEIIGSDGDRGRFDVTLPAPFNAPQRHQVEWTNYLTPQALIDLVASRSYCITSPTEVRTRTLDQVRELLGTHPALANSAGLALPYVTIVLGAQELLGMVEDVGTRLASSKCGGGIHCVSPSAFLRVVQPPGLSNWCCGPQAKVRSLTSVVWHLA